MRTWIEPTVTAAVLIAALCACGLGGNKVSECNKLIDVMNKGADQVRKAKAAGATDVADLEKMATSMDDLANNVTRLSLTNADLKKRADSYATNARDMARAAREMAAAVRVKDRAKTVSAKAAIDKAVAAEQPLVNDINSFCKAP
jgi:hypothetical protein